MQMRTFHEANEYLGSKQDRPLEGRATRLQRREDGSIAVRYQATDVVTYRPDSTIKLDSVGWRTPTTKERISTYTRVRVYADRGVWYLNTGTSWREPKDTPRVLFADGMVVREDGTPVEPHYETPTDTTVKRRLDKAVTQYIKGFVAVIEAGELPEPGNGDCWGCLMQVKDAPTVTQGPMRRQGMPTPHGRTEVMGIDHYLSHMGLDDPEELYYVPSLLWNAITTRGYRDPGFIGAMIWQQKDGGMAAGILRSYFKALKPALLAELQKGGAS